MANVVKLYFTRRIDATKWELIAGKLLVIDDIADYLATQNVLQVSNFQYIKNELEISINVDISQSYSQPLTAVAFKYVSIQNENELVHYYYVKKAIWRSKSTVRLELVMDVLNTFKEGTDYNFKESTKILREHKSRFVQKNFSFVFNYERLSSEGIFTLGSELSVRFQNGGNEYVICTGTITAVGLDTISFDMSNAYDIESVKEKLEEYGDYLILRQGDSVIWIVILDNYTYDSNIYRNIDEVPEALNPLLFNAKNEGDSIENNVSALQGDWFLLYRNQNDPDPDNLDNPVDCYLIPSAKGIQVDSGAVLNGRVIPSYLETGKYYYFYVDSGQTYTLSDGHTFNNTGALGTRVIMVRNVNNKLQCTFLEARLSNVLVILGDYEVSYMTITGLPAYYAKENSSTSITANYIIGLDYDNEFNNSGTYTTLDDITLLDRVDAKNIKLIKLPYCPYNFSFDDGIMEIGDEDYWELVELTQSGGGVIHILKLKDLNRPLSNTIELIGSNNPFAQLFFGLRSNINPAITDLKKNKTYESKLYNSEFSYNSFYYDSFALRIQLEKCDLSSYIGYSNRINKCTINFDCTKTINSRFLFTFANYYLKNGEQNFNKYLPIARNNEEVLYNVPYINFIRTGYNYEVKAKQLQRESNWIGVGLSTAATASALLLPSAPLKVAGVVAGIVSIAQNVKNAVVSDMQAQNSLDQKLQQYKNQTASVSGSDDVDLMSIYADNRLKVMKYRPRENTEDLIFNLFFYAGYKSERLGLPNHHTRVNFDYLECEAMIESVTSIPRECLEELINCFKNGVTYLHKTSRSGANKWDFLQKYENWELELLEG